MKYIIRTYSTTIGKIGIIKMHMAIELVFFIIFSVLIAYPKSPLIRAKGTNTYTVIPYDVKISPNIN